MTGIAIEVTGIAEAFLGMRETQRRIASGLSGIALDIGLAAQADTDRRFDSSPPVETGGPVSGGINWPALTEGYLASRPERLGGQIYRDTGELQQSFQILRQSQDEIVYGSNLTKAGRLQELRPIVFAHPALVQTVENIMVAHLVGGF